ncbi:hypothetical protein JW949_03645 [Candidatus Woesearchaeota archaeon]|nr:hypothetical protein [Candidatus Woesearchaeota archaeon]
MDEFGKSNLMKLAVIVIAMAGTRGCNMAFNNRDIKKDGRHTISHATAITGHREYTIYNDGSTDVKVYPGVWGHRIASSKLYQDLDGDGLVDRIRVNGPEWQAHRLKSLLIREYNYEDYKDEFHEADRILSQEAERYNKKQVEE